MIIAFIFLPKKPKREGNSPMIMLKQLKITTLVAAAMMLVACGGGGGNSGGTGGTGDTGGTGGTGVSVSGIASAPSGIVAQLKHRNGFEVALDFIISPAAAAVIGLNPVTGATVELIRVDNDGNQVGDVLATTSTSITGNYSLKLPVGVNLAGNLVVRITGSGGTQMRAQVVEQTADITPVSEFILRKYIDNGVNLSNLVPTDVITLKGKVDDFDITAGADISAMLATLENELGDYVDNTVAASVAVAGDASTIAGDYRSQGFILSLHDGDQASYGSVESEIFHSAFTFADGGNGRATFISGGEEGVTLRIQGAENGASFANDPYTNTGTESKTMAFSAEANGTMSLMGDFSEEINLYDPHCCGWRWLPATYRFQKVKNHGLFFGMNEEANVRYGLMDTNHDNVDDAVDPNAKVGDEVFRELEVVARKPSAMTGSDLSGDFGHVYMGIDLAATGPAISVETETNVIHLNGNGTMTIGAVSQQQHLSRSAYNTSTVASGGTVNIVTTPDGDISSVNGSNVDGFVNDSYDFIAMGDAASQSQSGNTSATMLVKLGTGTPSVTGKTYRVMAMSMSLNGTSIGVNNSRFGSTVTMSSETAGTFNLTQSTIQKSNLGAEVIVSNSEAPARNVSASIGVGSNVSTLTFNDGTGNRWLEGYFNADASFGIFRSKYTKTGDSTPSALGVVVLVQTN